VPRDAYVLGLSTKEDPQEIMIPSKLPQFLSVDVRHYIRLRNIFLNGVVHFSSFPIQAN
jgi:hypothetical protein